MAGTVTHIMTSLTTVTRAFEILDLLWKLDGAGPTEIAAELDVPNSTVYDYLESLTDTKFVNKEKGEYTISAYFLTIAGRMRYRNRLFQLAQPEMRRLSENTGELIGLTVEMGGVGVILHQEGGDQALSLGTYPGASTPLHTVATGKAILANLSEDRIDEILDQRGLEARTQHTITDPGRLKAELAEIRADGYAVDWDEQVIGMGMIAVPITVEAEVLGSIGIVVPTKRIQDEAYQADLLDQLQEVQNTITVNYQYGQ